MRQRDPKSTPALAIVTPGAAVSVRLRPPGGLTAAELGHWQAVAGSRAAVRLGPEHVQLLAQFVRHAAIADQIARRIAAFDLKLLRDDAGLMRYDVLTAMFARATGQIKAFATTLKLTQQSSMSPRAAGRAAAKVCGGPAPWQSSGN